MPEKLIHSAIEIPGAIRRAAQPETGTREKGYRFSPPTIGSLLSIGKRYLLMLFAWCCLALGVVGIFIPGLPTTVFILLAGWAAAQSSPRFSHWLENHKLFGPMLCNWRETRSVSRRAKWSATMMMVLCAAILFLTAPHIGIAGIISVLMAAVLVWLWRRPEPQSQHFVDLPQESAL